VAEASVTEKLAFLPAQRQQDEATRLAPGVQEGIQVRHREALMETHLLKQIPRELVFVGVQHRLLAQDLRQWEGKPLAGTTAAVGCTSRNLGLSVSWGIASQQGIRLSRYMQARWSRIHRGGA